MWQKVVLTDAAGRWQGGTRAGFVTLLCFSKQHRVPRHHVTVDVLADRGHMSYGHAMGGAACSAAIEYVKEVAALQSIGGGAGGQGGAGGEYPVIVDFFCGHGSVLGVANAHGLPAIGMEINLKCCTIAAGHVAKEGPVQSL